jgi:hypothetical protein
VDVKVKRATDLVPVVDDALRLVWTSKLNPLHSNSVDVTDSQDWQRYTSESALPFKVDEKAKSEAKFGPRPKIGKGKVAQLEVRPRGPPDQ